MKKLASQHSGSLRGVTRRIRSKEHHEDEMGFVRRIEGSIEESAREEDFIFILMLFWITKPPPMKRRNVARSFVIWMYTPETTLRPDWPSLIEFRRP
jgi:hypothetical protein